jgi:glucose-6-phosphate isomerase
VRFRSVLEDPFVELDLGHAGLVAADVDRLRPGLEKALAAMQKLEAGAIANADEQRMVGHFWLRAPGLAPKPELEDLIASTIAGVEAFAQAVHSGRITPPEGGTFTKVVLVGIGGSALGPMLLELEALEVCSIVTTSDVSAEEIPDELFQGLATLLALVAPPRERP